MCSYFLGCGHERTDVGTHEIPKVLSGGDDLVKRVFLFWLEWKGDDIILPILQIFELRASSVAWNLDPPVADWTSILVVFLDFAASDFKTFTMVPVQNL